MLNRGDCRRIVVCRCVVFVQELHSLEADRQQNRWEFITNRGIGLFSQSTEISYWCTENDDRLIDGRQTITCGTNEYRSTSEISRQSIEIQIAITSRLISIMMIRSQSIHSQIAFQMNVSFAVIRKRIPDMSPGMNIQSDIVTRVVVTSGHPFIVRRVGPNLIWNEHDTRHKYELHARWVDEEKTLSFSEYCWKNLCLSETRGSICLLETGNNCCNTVGASISSSEGSTIESCTLDQNNTERADGIVLIQTLARSR